MPANPHWTRWIFASIAYAMKEVATDEHLPILIEHLDERTKAFMEATDKAEVRITGPFSREISKGCHELWVDANVLLTSRYDGASKNAYNILRLAGLYHNRMDNPIAVWNYGNLPGDYVEGETDTQFFLGCLRPLAGRNDRVRVFHFGQIDKTDKIKQTAVDARYVLYLDEADFGRNISLQASSSLSFDQAVANS